jgi:hypothetical protein
VIVVTPAVVRIGSPVGQVPEIGAGRATVQAGRPDGTEGSGATAAREPVRIASGDR